MAWTASATGHRSRHARCGIRRRTVNDVYALAAKTFGVAAAGIFDAAY
jgi:hypothetical protein